MITGIKLGGLPKEDLESLASLNRIIRNYIMMKELAYKKVYYLERVELINSYDDYDQAVKDMEGFREAVKDDPDVVYQVAPLPDQDQGIIFKKLRKRNDEIELLEAYSKFLESSGYIDSDCWQEQPTAIDEFLKERG